MATMSQGQGPSGSRTAPGVRSETQSDAVSLVSQWFIAPGCQAEAIAAIRKVAADVLAGEPGTLTYLVHTPLTGVATLESVPPAPPGSVVFFETYANPEAFEAHVNGPIFTEFVAKYGRCFVTAHTSPYTTVQFLDNFAGFARTTARPPGPVGTNRHPSVMFEIIAKDSVAAQDFYQRVFGWQYQTGTGGFAYIGFPVSTRPLLGGIGQASSDPGFEPGRNFYLLVDSVEETLESALTAGASHLMAPTSVDGYRIAMFRDPEGNPVGLIEPFQASNM
jgi:uncharacterized protein